MTQFDRLTLGRQAKELGFVRDTFEKVCRLVDVLSFMEKDPALSDTLALKGGTAINLALEMREKCRENIKGCSIYRLMKADDHLPVMEQKW